MSTEEQALSVCDVVLRHPRTHTAPRMEGVTLTEELESSPVEWMRKTEVKSQKTQLTYAVPSHLRVTVGYLWK